MSRKPEGERPLTAAERQARQRERRTERVEVMRKALEQIAKASTTRDARAIATAALAE